jgi:PhzF family phenazine biosynthesis protein
VAEQTGLDDDDRRRVPVLAGASHAVFIEAEDGDSRAPVSVRFFTAEGELPACGHGTIAALAYLAARAGEQVYQARLRVAGRHGIQGWARRQGNQVAAEFEAGRVGLREPTAGELADVTSALDLPDQARAPGACVATLGRWRMLVPVATRPDLDTLRPDQDALRDACVRHGLLGCYAYTVPARGTGRCAARMFAPAIGVPEDIANANSTACLAARLRATEPGHTGVTVDMGDSLDHPATITAAVADSAAGTDPLVHVGGVAQLGRTMPLR